MYKESLKQYCPKSAKEWRAWLEKNHDTQPGVWLVYFKKHTKKATVTYNESVEEALCFGWIDSTKRRLDDERYMHIFTPRNPKSNWSETNKKRVEKLIGEGKMKESGLHLVEYAKTNGLWDKKKPSANKSFEFSEDLQTILESNDKAFSFYKQLSPSSQKLYKQWVMSAKRPETRKRRFSVMIIELEKKIKPGMK